MNEWLIGLCKRQGLSHIKEGKACQDHIEYSVNDAQTCMAAVLADGLGSRENSQWAAIAATKAAMNWLMNNSEWLCEDGNAVEVIQHELLEKVRNSVAETAEERGVDIETMDCNLAFLCIQTPFRKAICGHLGDCAVCILDEKPRVLTAQSGSAIGTNTVMTARPDEICVQIVDLSEKTNGFILTTDGLDGEIYRKNSTFVQHAAKNYFNTVFAADHEKALDQKIQELQKMKGDRFEDDISIVVACRAKAPIDLPKDPQWLCRCKTRNPLTSSYCAACHADFLTLYPSSFTNRFNSLDDAILYLNDHPREERELLGLPAQGPQKPAKETGRTEILKPRENKPQGPAEAGAAQQKEQSMSAEERARLLNPNLTGGSSSFVEQQVQKLGEETNKLEKEYSAASNEQPGTNGTAGTSRAGGRGPTVSNGDIRRHDGERFLTRWELPILIGALILIALTLLFGRLFPGSSGDRPFETSPSTHQTDGNGTKPTDPQRPENYAGEMKDGVPHGSGVLYKDGYFWVGHFVDGKMDGVFQKISANDTGVIEQVEFDMGKEKKEEDTETQQPTSPTQQTVPYVLDRDVNRLYIDEGLQNRIIVDLRAGDIVLLTNRELLEIDGETWGWVETDQGNGWCRMDALRVVEDDEN